MSEPAALGKARAVVRHAKQCGVRPREFLVSLTKDEAFELLDWIVSTADPVCVDVVALEAEARQAHEHDDPFMALGGRTVLGLPIVPVLSLH